MRGILAFLLLTVLLCGCAGAGDWASEPLAGDYALWRLSGYRVELVRERESGGADSVIGALV